MSANHYRLVGEGAREDAAEQIWQEYTSSEYRHAKTPDRLGNGPPAQTAALTALLVLADYADASNRTYEEILRYLLWTYPTSMLSHLPAQLKNKVTTGKTYWNSLV